MHQSFVLVATPVLLAVLVIACAAFIRSAGQYGVRRRRRRLLICLLPAALVSKARAAQDKPLPELTVKAPRSLLSKLEVYNISESAQPAGFVCSMFGHAFRQGDIPPGHRPEFVLQDGSECPATFWGVSSWPDGSMKFCAAMLQIPASLRAGGRLTLEVHAGASAPEQRATRSLNDLRQVDIRIVLNGIDALDGAWTASVSDGLRSGSDIVEIANGPAGAIWRIGSEFRAPDGKLHGQLYCWHYVAVLTGPTDAPAAVRYLGRVAQPWTDVATPPPRHRDFSATLHMGERELRTLQGHAQTETPGPTIRLPHYASFFTAGPDAQWDFIAIGATAGDGRVRVVIDSAYCIASKLVPPYDLRTPVDDAATADYYPMGRGTVVRAMGGTGERADIGLLPEWNVRHLIRPSIENERIARVNAMSAAGWRLGFRKRATRHLVPGVDIRPTYAKLGQPEVRWRGYSHMQGMVRPSPNDSLWREDTAHRPGCVYWPYLFTGEPQYLDILLEHSFAHILDLNAGNQTTWGTTFPRDDVLEGPWRGERGICIGTTAKLYKGSGVLLHGSGGTRMTAWRSRDVAQAAAIAPDAPADGAGTREYLRDVLDSAYAAFRDYMTQVPASYRESGLFIQSNANGAPWQIAYLSWSVCHQADILGSPAAAHVRQHLARFWESFSRQADMACIVAYTCSYRDTHGKLAQSTRDVLGLLQCRLDFDAVTSRIAIADAKGKPRWQWQPRNGDRFAFDKKRAVPLKNFAMIQPFRQLFAVNCQGQSFQLALEENGPPIRFPESVSIDECFASLKDFSPDLAFSRSNSAHGYSANICGAVHYHLACGDEVHTAARELDRIVQAQRVNFRNRPKYRVTGRRA